jgi:hypothetical protein
VKSPSIVQRQFDPRNETSKEPSLIKWFERDGLLAGYHTIGGQCLRMKGPDDYSLLVAHGCTMRAENTVRFIVIARE